jgi:hypothetical protein
LPSRESLELLPQQSGLVTGAGWRRLACSGSRIQKRVQFPSCRTGTCSVEARGFSRHAPGPRVFLLHGGCHVGHYAQGRRSVLHWRHASGGHSHSGGSRADRHNSRPCYSSPARGTY